MDSARRRSSSFHTDLDLDLDLNLDVGLGSSSSDVVAAGAGGASHPPSLENHSLHSEYQHTALRDNHGGSSEASSSQYVAGEAETVDSEPEVRVRSRSRSVHENDDLPSSDLVPRVGGGKEGGGGGKQQLQPGAAGGGGGSGSGGSGEQQPSPKELVGPIKSREALALRQGLEEASGKTDERALREEQAEREAAARERAKRSSAATASGAASGNPASGSPGADIVPRKIKVLVLGDSGVGKSSIICRYISDSFNPSLVSTLGVDLKTKRVHVDDKLVQVQVWDTAGQTAFHRITTSYYRGSNAILLVYDISERATLENIEYWMKNIKQEASENVRVALIGNKTDLRTKEGYAEVCVKPEEGRAVAEKYKVIYAETSAMTSGAAVEEAFDKLVRQVLAAESPQNKPHRFTSSDGSKSPEISSLFSSRSKSVPAATDGKGLVAKHAESTTEEKNSEEEKKCVIS